MQLPRSGEISFRQMVTRSILIRTPQGIPVLGLNAKKTLLSAHGVTSSQLLGEENFSAGSKLIGFTGRDPNRCTISAQLDGIGGVTHANPMLNYNQWIANYCILECVFQTLPVATAADKR